MRKVLGIALATVFTLTIAAAAVADEGTGRSVILDNGTTITVSEKPIADLAAGDQVKAMFETQGSKSVVANPEPAAIGSEFRSTTSWGPSYGTQMDSIQAE
jgi:hypothetical protein